MQGSAYEFAALVDQKIAALSSESFHLRTRHAKRLLEELYPISRFALYCLTPGVTIDVEAFEDNRPMDAIIRISHQGLRELHVEVTYVYSYEDALRAELLWTQKSVPGTGPIFRDKENNRIVAAYAPVSPDEEADHLGMSIVMLFRKKAAKEYRPHTILIIAFEDPIFFGQTDWQRLLASVKRHGGLSNGGFEEVHLFNVGSNDFVSHAHILD